MLKLKFLVVQMMKGMVFESEEQTLLIDISRGNRLGYYEEPMAKVVREL